MPVVAAELARQKRHDAIICLGAVIRGDTPHFDYVAGEAARGLMQVSIRYRLPIGFGVLTVETMQQATDRAGGKAGNKGHEAAAAALRAADVLRELGSYHAPD
jgi:6,7-dimethyl-8-ribityllumazine synthase